MSSVDDRIVNMQFNNSTFEQKVGTTISALSKLSQALNLEGASKGLDGISAAAGRTDLGPLSTSLDRVNAGFAALATVAITALANIANRAVDAGITLVKSLSVDPLLDGYREYETNLNSIQTILSNTGLKGQKGLDEVNGALQELNHYSDKTIYNFAEMARNVGTFTTAGVDLDTSVGAIKGISNLAALSGSSAAQAATGMYQLSQAISTGTVRLQDWISVEHAGFGGKIFQNALADTARQHGVAIDEMIKKNGSFRASLAENWLTSDILTETLQQFTGDLTDAQLKSMGYSDQQIKKIQDLAKTAVDSATKVKTATALFGTLQEAVGSGWSQTFSLVIGDFGEAKELFTGVNNVIGGMIQESAKARNKVLGDWKDLGGRDLLLDSLANAFWALMDVLSPIKKAFRDIFPAQTGKTLFELTKRFHEFTEDLSLGEDTMNNLRRTFRGVFAVFDILWQVVKGVASVFGDLFSAAGEGAGGFLNFTGNIGDLLVRFDEFLKKGHVIENFFDGIGSIVQVPIRLLTAFGELLGGLWDGFQGGAADAAGKSMGTFSERVERILTLGEKLGEFGAFVGRIFAKIVAFIQPAIDLIGDAFSGLGDAIAQSMATGNFDSVIDVLNTVLLGGIFLAVKRFLTKGLGNVGGGFISSITKSFGALTGTLKAMQANIQASTLLKIASAVGILTLSVVALSLINSRDLTKALTAMSVGFGQLLLAMALLVKISGSAGFVKVPAIAAAMVLLASSILILTAAVALMGQLKWETIGKGLAGIAAVLTVIAGAMRLMPRGMVGQAAALVLIGLAVNELGLAIAGMGQMEWSTIGKGLATMAGALVIIAGAIALMPPTMALQAVGLVILSKALILIGLAVAGMGMMSWDQIAHGLVALGGALIVIAAGLAVMQGSVAGAAALVITAGALAILAPVLISLGAMSWEAIVRGLVTLAAALLIIGAAGLVLGPLTPALLALGAAMFLLGAGLALAGAGALAFSAAFTALAVAGSAGVQVMGAMLDAIIKRLPHVALAFAKMTTNFVVGIANQAPKLMRAFAKILDSLLDAVIKVIPKIGRAFTVLLQTALRILNNAIPGLVRTGFNLIMALLHGISNNIERIVRVVTDIIVRFLRALGDNLPRIVDAGAKMIIKFVHGMADAIRENADEMGEAGADLGIAIVEGMIEGVASMGGELLDKVGGLAGDALGKAGDILHIGSPSRAFRDEVGRWIPLGMAEGIDSTAHVVARSSENLGKTALDTITLTLSKVKDAAEDNIDVSPRIAPVLDLTRLTQDANKMHGILEAKPLKPDVSFEHAKDVSAKLDAAKRAAFESQHDHAGVHEVLKFEQTINSPKPVDSVEVYRGTRNQLSMAKEALSKR